MKLTEVDSPSKPVIGWIGTTKWIGEIGEPTFSFSSPSKVKRTIVLETGQIWKRETNQFVITKLEPSNFPEMPWPLVHFTIDGKEDWSTGAPAFLYYELVKETS